MKNKKNTSKLKCLLPITSAVLAFGLSLNTNPAQALSLVLKTSLSRNPITIIDNQNKSLDLDHSLNTIHFNQRKDGLVIKGILKKSIIRDRFIPDVGTKVNGFFLNLTELEVMNVGNTPIDLGFNNYPPNNFFIFFSDSFSFSNPTYASQLLDGSFENGGLSNTVTLRGRAYGNLIEEQKVPRGQSDFNLSSNSKKISQASSNLVSGNLKSLTLRSVSKLKLPNSACVLVLDTPVNGNQTKRICDRVASVPEPSSVISLLALGIFGGGFLLKGRGKSSDS
jgi:hypothetical protein